MLVLMSACAGGLTLDQLHTIWRKADAEAHDSCSTVDSTGSVPLLFTIVSYSRSVRISALPSADHPPECAIVFVNKLQLHITPGWTQVCRWKERESSVERSSKAVTVLRYQDEPITVSQPLKVKQRARATDVRQYQ